MTKGRPLIGNNALAGNLFEPILDGIKPKTFIINFPSILRQH